MRVDANYFEPEIKALFSKMIDAKGPYIFNNNQAFMVLFIFNTLMGDLMWQLQEAEKIKMEDRMKMAEDLGFKIRELVRVYAGLDSHKLI
jgi:hypothetical protein